MKTPFSLFWATLICVHPLPAAEPVLANDPAPSAVPVGLEVKLGRVIIPDIQLTQVTLQESLDFLAKRANDLGKDAGKVSFVLEDPDGVLKSRQVTWLKLRNVPGKAALQYVLTICGAKARYDAHAIVISPQKPPVEGGLPPDRFQRLASAAGKNRESQLSHIIVPVVDFQGVTLQEGLEFLEFRAKGLEKDARVANFVVEDQTLLTRQVKSLQMKNVPVTAALLYMLQQCGAEARYDDSAIVVIPSRPATTDTRTERERTIEAVAVQSREAQLSKIRIPKIHLQDAPLEESIAFLAARISEATGGKTTVNFVVQDPGDLLKSRRVASLKLNDVPAREAIAYVLQQCNAKARYDEHAIVISP